MHFLVLKFVTPNSNYRLSKFNVTVSQVFERGFSFKCLQFKFCLTDFNML